jgi:hypothetical protein
VSDEADQSEDNWLPVLGGASEGRFKWGWDRVHREAVVWSVSGPGDGLPSHDSFLTTAWGRRPSQTDGDTLGAAWLARVKEGEQELVIEAFQEKAVPENVVGWFRRERPDLPIRVIGCAGAGVRR